MEAAVGSAWNGRRQRYDRFKFFNIFIPWIPNAATGDWCLPSKQFCEEVKRALNERSQEMAERSNQTWYEVDGWNATGKLIITVHVKTPSVGPGGITDKTRLAMMDERILPTEYYLGNVSRLVEKALIDAGVVGSRTYLNPIIVKSVYCKQSGVNINLEAMEQKRMEMN